MKHLPCIKQYVLGLDEGLLCYTCFKAMYQHQNDVSRLHTPI